MGLSVAIVGLPNAGKSTLFNALTKAGAVVGNYPFTTIEPNTGVVQVPDTRLDRLSDLFKPPKTIAATVTFTDVAGLVRGASQGEGLGNQFLGHIRECDAICLVTRDFSDPDVTHVEGSVDPLRDIDVIELELALADLDAVNKRLEKTEKTARLLKDKSEVLIATLRRAQEHLNNGAPVRTMKMKPEERASIRELFLLTIKPLLVVANVDETRATGEPSKELQARVAQSGGSALCLSARIESEIAELPTEDQPEFLATLGLKETGLNHLARSSYALLDLITFFTAGETEVRAWELTRGKSIVDAAGSIHTDFAKGFIRAEVVGAEELLELGSYQAVREAGKLRVEGRDYIVRDGDCVHIRFNV